MKASEIAERAAEVVAQRGHTKGFMYNEAGNVCAQGALHVALAELIGLTGPTIKLYRTGDQLLNHNDRYPTLYRAVCDTAFTLLEERYVLEGYNDLAQTSAEDVTLLLKRTAEALKEAGK